MYNRATRPQGKAERGDSEKMEDQPVNRFGLLSAIAFLMAAAASAGIITYSTPLNGASEIPANSSTATGFATVTVDNVANTMMLNVIFSGLSAGATGAHIHCCVPPGSNTGVATTLPAFVGFPLGATSGTYMSTISLLDAGSYNPAFVTAQGGTVAGAEAALLAGLAAGQTYFNIHDSTFPGGEIRGILAPVPEPGTMLLSGLSLIGLAALGGLRRRG
jgi:hypothetical protein